MMDLLPLLTVVLLGVIALSIRGIAKRLDTLVIGLDMTLKKLDEAAAQRKDDVEKIHSDLQEIYVQGIPDDEADDEDEYAPTP